ncbi:MAG: hypothetical protein ACXW4Z_24345, partial [Candidatus Binatia bacterium]
GALPITVVSTVGLYRISRATPGHCATTRSASDPHSLRFVDVLLPANGATPDPIPCIFDIVVVQVCRAARQTCSPWEHELVG